MKLRWFLSGTVREATDMVGHVDKLLNAQRDLLSPQALSSVASALQATQSGIDEHVANDTLRARMVELEAAANKWLKPYPNSGWRENIEVFLVAIAVAMAIRTFFLQPFKIPTGSMQPTLYGVEYEPMQATPDQPAKSIPGGFGRFWDACVRGTFYHHLVAEADGELIGMGPGKTFLRFINRQELIMQYHVGGQTYQKAHTLWFSPDEDQKFVQRANLYRGRICKKGEDIVRIAEIAGDHLFVDRFIYNFRPPDRGEIIVFKTKGIMHPGMKQDQFYIKRLVALGGENVSIGDDQHLRINGVRLDASTPRFGSVYSFSAIPQENHYFGHVNETIAQKVHRPGLADPLFLNEQTVFPVSARHYLVMGDNTLNSWDSRGWGSFPRENVIGKSFFVYWPVANHGESRFGWGHTAK
ncbi:MAG: signal peptidase I [Verrucomicrobiota bacterium]